MTNTVCLILAPDTHVHLGVGGRSPAREASALGLVVEQGALERK